MWNETSEMKELILGEEMIKLIEDLQNVEKEFKTVLKKYSEDFSKADKKQQDILHYIEFKKVSSVSAYRLVNELCKVRKERRIAEDNVDLLNKLGNEFTFNNKKVIKDIVTSKNAQMKKRKYNPRYYTPTSLSDIANKKGEVEC